MEISKKDTPVSFAIRKQFDRTIKKLFERNITTLTDE